MKAVRYVREKDTLTIYVGDLAVARVVNMGTLRPEIEVRDSRGGWGDKASIDDKYARVYLRPYAELAAWVRAQVLREVSAGQRSRSCAPRRWRKR